MDFTVSLLLGTFLLSIAALFAFIGSMSKGLFGDGTAGATQIFASNEVGTVEDPAATPAQKSALQRTIGTVVRSSPDMTAADGIRSSAHPPCCNFSLSATRSR